MRPLRGGERHYVPILQPHPGELRALTDLADEARERVTPLIEVATMKGEAANLAPQSPLARLGPSLQSALGVEDLFFLDFNEQISEPLALRLLQACNLSALQFIPVTHPERLSLAKAIISAIGTERGVCVRFPISPFTPTGIGLDDALRDLLEELSVERAQADLILDLGYLHGILQARDVFRVLGEIDALDSWRSLILAATTMPSSFTQDDFQLDSDTVLPRREWTLYEELRSLRPPRVPVFADYGVQGASRPHKGFIPVPNLRYTANRHTVVLRGHKKAPNDRQHSNLCARMVARPEFAGPRFSVGDSLIDACAQGRLVLRNQEALRGIGTSHHIRLVTGSLEGLR